MGNRFGKICACSASRNRRSKNGSSGCSSDEGLGHSFCYVRPETTPLSSSKVHHSEETTTTFRSISGAALCANTSTPLSTDLSAYAATAATLVSSSAAFESSVSFQSIPLQPVPRSGGGVFSGPIGAPAFSGPIERGFLSGPIERGFLSGPLDKNSISGPLDRLQRSFSQGGAFSGRTRKATLMNVLCRAISNATRSAIVTPVKLGVAGFLKDKESSSVGSSLSATSPTDNIISGGESTKENEDFSFESQNLQWAQGKAGEDRVHIVISEEHEWLFVGIYDGFNGPDAPDYLLCNLYTAVQNELKGLLWNQPAASTGVSLQPNERFHLLVEPQINGDSQNSVLGRDLDLENIEKKMRLRTKTRGRKNCRKNMFKGVSKKWGDGQIRWKEQCSAERVVDNAKVMKALLRALRKTEKNFLEITDTMIVDNPELALMGSCVLVMLMKGEDIYLMNVGDSRGVLAQRVGADIWDLERINEESPNDLQLGEDVNFRDTNLPQKTSRTLSAMQLTLDHSTSVKEEVRRIRKEHPDDPSAITNDRVKGSLKVTRAFGAGFLKQRKWNDALLEMFQIDYIGTAPYLSCVPSLCHHGLGPGDRFLILSSDGLYQYFTNEEAVVEVESFIQSWPEGDPAQHLVEEVLFRAAKKAGMDFHELLEIPQGERRRYHDDVSIIVISLEGRIWRSCV